jgi:hypothetical protein
MTFCSNYITIFSLVSINFGFWIKKEIRTTPLAEAAAASFTREGAFKEPPRQAKRPPPLLRKEGSFLNAARSLQARMPALQSYRFWILGFGFWIRKKKRMSEKSHH